MEDHDAAFHHHLFDLAEAEREPVIQPHTVTNDLHREAEPLVRRHNDGHQPSLSPTEITPPIIPATDGLTKLTVPAAVAMR